MVQTEIYGVCVRKAVDDAGVKEEFMAKAQLKILNDEIGQIKRELGPAIIEQGKDGIRVKILLKNAESAIAKKEMIERALRG